LHLWSVRTPATYSFSVKDLVELLQVDGLVAAQAEGDALELFGEIYLLLVPARGNVYDGRRYDRRHSRESLLEELDPVLLGQALVAVLVEELEQLLEQLLQDEFYKLKRRLTKIRKRWVDP
jgi:hypothetical protein